MKEIVTAQAQMRLREFLAAPSFLYLPRPRKPKLSILLVLHNRAELTLACLRSLQPCLSEVMAEIILVDNASHDDTSVLLDRIRGAVVIRNGNNAGFPCGVNQAAAAAGGEYLLLLNNDTEVLGDSISAARHFLAQNHDVGAVGGRLMALDGTLQEAGCSLWREGHVFQYGQGDSPAAAEYQFQRDVDYCSGAFLMTRRDLFHQIGELDTAFTPGYFEDADYCVRLWRAGWRVVYLPEVLVRHYGNASSPDRKELLQLYRRNHLYFTQKHADWLAWKCSSVHKSPLWVRSSHDDRFKVLYLPTSSECSAIASIVRRLGTLSCFVTIYPLRWQTPVCPRELADVPADMEVLPGGDLNALDRFLNDRRDYYDCIVAREPEVLEHLKRSIGRHVATSASS